MFNLVNHSDTIACVLFELLVIWNWFTWVSKPTIRFHKFQFCSIFKVLLAVRISRDSLFIISQKFLFVKNFFEIFEVFSQSLAPRKALKGCCYAVFSGFPCRSRAGQLDYNTTGETLCQHFFSFFSTNFSGILWLNRTTSFLGISASISGTAGGPLQFPSYYNSIKAFLTEKRHRHDPGFEYR